MGSLFSGLFSVAGSWFTNAKVVIVGIIGAIVAGYLISENIKRKSAEAKVIKIQNDINLAHIQAIKTNAKIASETKDLEMGQHIETIQQLKQNKVEAEKELSAITTQMQSTADSNGKKGLFSFDGLTPVKDKV
jgi:Tfp pilus assembly protein FimT